MSVALELREAAPAARILILERGYMTSGASSRNAGFACMGSATELLDDLEHMPSADVVQLFADRKKGLERLRRRLGDQTIGYTENGSYELLNKAALPALEQLDFLNGLLQPVTGKPAFRPAPEQIAVSGFHPVFTRAMIENTCEGALHTGKMLRALTDLCISRSIEIKTGTEVTSFEETANGVQVMVPDPIRGDTWLLQCRQLVVCTNAFVNRFSPDEDVVPGRGQVLITHPVKGLKFTGIYHFDNGYYYFRELDGRVLFGGGRNLDFKTETTTQQELNPQIQQQLETLLREVILPDTPFTIDRKWSGIMAFGHTKQPIVKAFSDKVYGAFRMGGMGVALGSEVAYRLVSELMNGQARSVLH